MSARSRRASCASARGGRALTALEQVRGRHTAARIIGGECATSSPDSVIRLAAAARLNRTCVDRLRSRGFLGCDLGLDRGPNEPQHQLRCLRFVSASASSNARTRGCARRTTHWLTSSPTADQNIEAGAPALGDLTHPMRTVLADPAVRLFIVPPVAYSPRGDRYIPYRWSVQRVARLYRDKASRSQIRCCAHRSTSTRFHLTATAPSVSRPLR
jgi:hypothetical protein